MLQNVDLEKRKIEYAANSHAWMNGELFRQWLHRFDLRMHGRKVLLLIDNASSHKVQYELNNVTVRYLPPNMTSRIQSLDTGNECSRSKHIACGN